MLHVKKNIKNYDDLHKKGCTNKFYVLLYMQTVDMHFLSGLHNATRRRCLNTEKKKCNDNNVYHNEKV